MVRRSARTLQPSLHAGRTCLNAMGLLLACLIAPAGAAPTLEVFVLSVGGQSTWFTYSAPQPVMDLFGPRGVGLPTNSAGLAASGIAGGYSLTSAAAGPLADANAIATPNWVTSWSPTNTFTGSSAANARYGRIGAEADGTYNGWSDSATVAGSEAFGAFRETMTVTAPSVANGTNGLIRFHLTIDGSLSSTGDAGTAGVIVNYQHNGGSSYTLMRATADPRGFGDFYPYSGPGRDGFSISTTAVSGSGTFPTFDLPIVFGTPFDIRFGLMAYVVPAKNNVLDVSFAGTAKLTGVEVFSSGGTPVAGFEIASGSGVGYSAVGVHLPGDIDRDGTVNVFDVFVIAEAWDTQVGDPTYNPDADLDGDGFVNVFDIFVLAENWNM